MEDDTDLGLVLQTSAFRASSFHFYTIRSACVYTFIAWSRKKPISVMPLESASSTARLEGAEMAAMQGMRASSAFWMISKEVRPLTSRICRL